jgi:hypothetical protein
LSALLAFASAGHWNYLVHKKFERFRQSEVIFVKGALNGLLALISLVLAAGCAYLYLKTEPASTLYLVGLIVFILLLVVFGGMFLSGRVNKTEEIHITE